MKAIITGFINRLEDGYRVVRPIPYRIDREDDGTFLASFPAANIAMVGVDRQDAYQSLIAEILDTFDTLESERALSPNARMQLATLRQHIVRA